MPAATQAHTSAGSFISIALAAPATQNAAGYDALTWVDIGEVTDIPEYGREYSVTEHKPLKTKRVVKLKAGYNEGSLTIGMARVRGDEGHQDLLVALDDVDPASFRVTYQDSSIEYFQALVMSYKSNIGNTDGVTSASAQLEITSNIVNKDPA